MKRMIFLGLAATALSACETYAEYGNVAAQLTPVAMAVSSEEKTAAKDETIFTQTAVASNVVTLDADFSGVVMFNASSEVPVTFAAGDVLYEVTDYPLPEEDAEAEASRTFCSTEKFESEKPKLAGRACLSDDDGDGDFDRPWYLYQFQGVTRYAGGATIGALEPLEAGVPYSTASAEALEPAEISIVFKTAALQGYFLNLATDGILNDPYTPESKIPSKDDLPAEVEVNGAVIEILSREGDEITYRVIKGFDETAPVTAYQATPPDTSADVASAVAATIINSYYGY